MSDSQPLISHAYNIVRSILIDTGKLKNASPVARHKLEMSIKKNLELLTRRIVEIEDLSRVYPVQDRPKLYLVIKDLKDNQAQILKSLENSQKSGSIELLPRSQTDYSDLSNNDLIKQQEMLKIRQEEDTDKLIQTVNGIKSAAREIGDEVDTHIKLLESTESLVDTNSVMLGQTSLRMARLIDKSSNNCLMLIIVLLILLIFFTLLYF